MKPRSPEHRAKLAEATRRRMADPAARQRVAEQNKRRWEDSTPEQRAERLAALHSTEARAKNSARVKERWRDPEYRTKQAERHQAAEEELSYSSWHARLRGDRILVESVKPPKTGVCETCGRDVGTDGRGGTEWSYTGSDPRGWEPNADLYVEECSSCNKRRGRLKGGHAK